MKVKELIKRLKTFNTNKEITINVCTANPYANEKLFSKGRKFNLHEGMFLSDNISLNDITCSADDNIIKVTIYIPEFK